MSKSFLFAIIVSLAGYVGFQSYLLAGYEKITDEQNQTIDRLFQACGAEVTHD